MIEKLYKATLLTLFGILLLPSSVSAHQPRITESRLTQVSSPEISKAYYGKLTGMPDVYVIKASEPFALYVNILVPDIAGQKKDLSVVVTKDGNVEKPLAVLNGIPFVWKKFYEPFGADTYWMGPEYKARAEAGTYEIRVLSSNNDSKYSLAIGETEVFDAKEGFSALTTIPKLKRDFFNVSPIGFISSPFGYGLIVILYLFAGIVGLVYRAIFTRIFKNTPRQVTKNIGKPDRVVRLSIGVGLLLFAMLTTWNPIIIFLSGFAIFEAISSWSAIYAAMGKNTMLIK